jgi:hypothetical protein
LTEPSSRDGSASEPFRNAAVNMAVVQQATLKVHAAMRDTNQARVVLIDRPTSKGDDDGNRRDGPVSARRW